MNERDEVLLRDMLDMARAARSFIVGETRESLNNDEKLALALERALEVIGEAARHVTDETRAALPQLHWHDIIGMRNRIIHEYRHIDYKVVWDTATEDLPPLIAELEKIFPRSPHD